MGHKVFGRSSQYDTIADNIVRVHASMLRKRLAEYFENEGRDENLIVEIPRGNYAPQFLERAPRRSRHTAIEIPHAEPISISPAFAEREIARMPQIDQVPVPVQTSDWRFRAASLFALLFCGLSIFLFLHGRERNQNKPPAITDQPTVRQFWARLFPSSGPSEVVLDDASLDFYQDAANHRVELAEYFDRSYLGSVEKNASALKLDPGLVHSLMLSRQSSFANVSLVWKLAQIADELHSSASVQFARDLTFRQVKNENVILLGNPQSNPWIQPFEPRLSLVWVIDPVSHSYYPRDKNAPASAQDQFRPAESEQNVRAGYATIAFLPNLSGTGNALILSATGGSAMSVAMNFLTDQNSMSQLRSRLQQGGAASFPYFEALLKTERGSKELNSVQVAICRSPALPAGSTR